MVSAPEPAGKQNNPKDAIGVSIAMSDMCVKDSGNTNSVEKYIPQNGEYVTDGADGDCNYCINCEPYRMDASAGCMGFAFRCASGGGRTPKYKRASYKADVAACCTSGGATTIGNLTCDPKYNGGPTTIECDGTFNTTCKGEALLSDNCKTWCDKNPDICRSKIISYCSTGNNIGTPYCKAKATSIGGMDAAVTAFCRTSPDDDFCSCYKAVNISSNETMDPETKRILARPECYLTKCSSGTAYQYDNMKTNKVCPPAILCKNTLVIASNVGGVDLNNVTQSCAGSIGTDGTTTNKNTSKQLFSNTPLTTNSKISMFFSKYNYLIIFIIILFTILGISTITLLSGNNSTPTNAPSAPSSTFTKIY